MKFNESDSSGDYNYRKAIQPENDAPQKKVKEIVEVCDYSGRGRSTVNAEGMRSHHRRSNTMIDFNRG